MKTRTEVYTKAAVARLLYEKSYKCGKQLDDLYGRLNQGGCWHIAEVSRLYVKGRYPYEDFARIDIIESASSVNIPVCFIYTQTTRGGLNKQLSSK